MAIISIVFLAVVMPRHLSLSPFPKDDAPAQDGGKTTGPVDQANDAATIAGARQIVMAIEVVFAQDGALPAPLAVAPTGSLTTMLPEWPDNPWDDRPMRPGGDPGDYRYERVSSSEYTFTVVLSDGEMRVD